MRRTIPLAVGALLVLAAAIGGVGTVAATSADAGPDMTGPIDAAAQTNNTTTTTDDNESDVQSGARLAGVIGANQAEHQAEVQTRALGVAMGAANSNGTKAAVLANYTERLQDRIQLLENQSEQLEARYEAGDIERGVYYGQSTALTARIRALERMIDSADRHAMGISQSELARQGMNETTLDELRNKTKTVQKPESAHIAERLAGPDVGHPIGPPEDVPGHGPSDDDDTHNGNGNGNSSGHGAEQKQNSGPNGSDK